MYEDIVSKWFVQSLAKHVDNPAEHLAALLKSPYKSFMMASEELLARIYAESDEKRKSDLAQEYLRDFYYMKATYMGIQILDEAKVRAMAESAHVSGEPTGAAIVELTSEERRMVELLKITEVIHDQRKKIALIGIYTLFLFLQEVQKRSNMEERLVRRIFWFELPDILKKPDTIREKLEKREYASIVWENGKTYALEYNAIIPRAGAAGDASECEGTPASRGKAKGPARIVLGESDFKKFRDRDVLIAEMTRPEYVSLMKKAAAIVTDEGGLMCHAAVVAREMQKPCVVGTYKATSMFKDGDMVEVDADKGLVRKI